MQPRLIRLGRRSPRLPLTPQTTAVSCPKEEGPGIPGLRVLPEAAVRCEGTSREQEDAEEEEGMESAEGGEPGSPR